MAGKLVQHPRVPTHKQYNREDVRPLEAKIERISIFCFLQYWDGSGKILSDLRLLRVGLISSLFEASWDARELHQKRWLLRIQTVSMQADSLANESNMAEVHRKADTVL